MRVQYHSQVAALFLAIWLLGIIPTYAQKLKKVSDAVNVIETSLKEIATKEESQRVRDTEALKIALQDLREAMEQTSPATAGQIAMLESKISELSASQQVSVAVKQLNTLVSELKKNVETNSPQQSTDGDGFHPNISGFVDMYYDVNFQKPANRINKFRNFDIYSNQVSLNFAKVKVEQVGDPIGFRFDAAVGPTADMVHTIDGAVDQTFKYVHQAYINVAVPGSGGLTIDLGKFVTHEGAEVIETNANWNYSRSLLFAWAIPYFHTGVRLTYPLSGNFTAMGMVANGWNRIVDNNDAKTFGAQFIWTPVEGLSLTQSWVGGPEQAGNNDNQRTVWDGVLAWQASKQLSFNVNYDYGYEDLNNAQATWSGWAGMARYTVSDEVALTVRGEWFYDNDGLQTGIAQQLREVTLTGEWRMDKRLLLRAEFRRDWSDVNVFDTQNEQGARKDQNTLIFGAIFEF